MIAFCLICEGAIKFVDTPDGIEAHCSDCWEPVEDAGEVAKMRGLGEDKRDAVEDLCRVQNEYLEATGKSLVANLFEEMQRQVEDEAVRQDFDKLMFVVGPFEAVPRQALELAKWAAQGK